MGRERKKVMHWSWDLVPTCSATSAQFSPKVSNPSSKRRVSSLVQRSGSISALEASMRTKSVSVIPGGKGLSPFLSSAKLSSERS